MFCVHSQLLLYSIQNVPIQYGASRGIHSRETKQNNRSKFILLFHPTNHNKSFQSPSARLMAKIEPQKPTLNKPLEGLSNQVFK